MRFFKAENANNTISRRRFQAETGIYSSSSQKYTALDIEPSESNNNTHFQNAAYLLFFSLRNFSPGTEYGVLIPKGGL